MSDTSHGTGGLTFDKTKKSWPSELNVLLALIIIIVIFEVLGQVLPYMNDQSFLFDTKDRFDSIFNEARLKIIILQVAIIGIIALGVSQVIITGGIDLSSGPLVAATAMIAMSFGQTELVNGFANPKALFGAWAMDLPVVVPVVIGLSFGAFIGAINGTFVSYFQNSPLYCHFGHVLDLSRHCALVVLGKSDFFPNATVSSDWRWYDAGVLVSVSGRDFSYHHALHRIWQTYLRNWFQRGSRAHVGDQCQTP